MATGLPIVPAQQNFPVQRGSAGAYALIAAQVKNPDGSLVNLAGATVEIITTINGLSVSTADGSLSVDIPSSTFSWYPTAVQTRTIPFGRVTKYRVWITFPGGSKGPYLEGFLDGDGAVGAQTTATIVLQGPQGAQGNAIEPATTISAGATQTIPYQALGTDLNIFVDKAVGSPTYIILPASPQTGKVINVKDARGDASINPITLSGGAFTIDGSAIFVMDFNRESVCAKFNGSEWSIF